MRRKPLQARVEGYIRTAREEGARLVTGGGRPEGRGWFVEPTVFADAPFGGVEGSGLGRELGPEGLAAYQQLQSIYLSPPTEG